MNHEITDRSGIWLSVLCGIHCLLTPLILMLTPTLGSWFESELVHLIFYILVVGLAVYTALSHYKMHRSRLVLGLFGLGILVLTFATFAIDHHENEILEKVLMALGGVFLVLGHIKNTQLCRCLRKDAQPCLTHQH